MTLKEELAEVDAELERLEALKRELYARSLEAPAHEKICADYIASLYAEPLPFKELKYPIEVRGITFTGQTWVVDGYPNRSLVRVRPCAAEYENKTFLGLYLGDVAQTMGCSFNQESGVLEVFLSHHNPAIWIPSRRRVVFGCESWWGPIRSEQELTTITDETIDGLWYVQAMRELQKKTGDDVEG